MIVDSVFWIAYKNTNDEWHKAAKKMQKILEDKEISLYVTDYIMIESTNHLLRKTNYEIAKETLNMMLNSRRISLIVNAIIDIQRTQRIFEQYKNLSFADANIVFHLINEKTDLQVLSFDSGFDNVKGINRIFDTNQI